MTALTLGEVSVTRVVEIGRSTFPTASMLPASTADAIARHHGWLKPDFWDAATEPPTISARASAPGSSARPSIWS
jgi:hypothetical protein